jgi:hypothetical protein
LSPAGVTVIEWAERWFGEAQGPKSKVQSPESRITHHASPTTSLAPPFRMVQIEVLSETERRISYEDFGT